MNTLTLSEPLRNSMKLPFDQEAIRAKCFHSSGNFVEFPRDDVERTIPERFEKIVAQHPHRLAIKTSKQAITYAELNASANRVARYILDIRGESNEPVAILLGHDAAIIVTILASLKAGKIYVPLDPAYPLSRNAQILQHSQARLILTDSTHIRLADQLAENAIEVIGVDDIPDNLSRDNPDLALPPDTLAWILYTSGTTGNPKGIVQSHRSVLQETLIYTNLAHISLDDRLALVSSCSFSDSIGTINGTLLNGARLVLVDIRSEGLTALADRLLIDCVSIYRSVPTVFRHFADIVAREQQFPSLRLIYLVGETVNKTHVEQYRKSFSRDCILLNVLGSTEALTFRIFFMDMETEMSGLDVPVGYAVDGKEVVLVNDEVQDAGCGSIGEIAVKSRYLAQGYWRNPMATRDKFLPDPDGGLERLYLTGDMGRMAPDGCLFHLGRKDFQVKIRGYRVELGEIEMALHNHDGVKEAAVTSDEDHLGETRITAYFVSSREPAPTTSDLRNFLQDKLPEYMLPSTFIAMDSFPLTETGKLDRRALPIASRAKTEPGIFVAAPTTALEKQLVENWREVLKIDALGIYDNFFDLGGHSLAAMRIVSRVFQQFQLQIPLQALFQSPTVADMAAVIAEHLDEPLGSEELEDILHEIESLSDEQAQRLVGEQQNTSKV